MFIPTDPARAHDCRGHYSRGGCLATLSPLALTIANRVGHDGAVQLNRLAKHLVAAGELGGDDLDGPVLEPLLAAVLELTAHGFGAVGYDVYGRRGLDRKPGLYYRSNL